jgi:hypothetical protein
MKLEGWDSENSAAGEFAELQDMSSEELERRIREEIDKAKAANPPKQHPEGARSPESSEFADIEDLSVEVLNELLADRGLMVVPIPGRAHPPARPSGSRCSGPGSRA